MPARQPRTTQKAAATPQLPPTTLQRIIAAETAKQRKAPKTAYQRETAKATRDALEDAFLRSLVNVPAPQRQYPLLPRRRYRADFAYPDLKLCIEVDGGSWLGSRGGHTSAAGMERDRIRDARCLLAGWTVLRVTATMIADGKAAQFTEQLYKMLAARRQQREGVA